ncbi:Flagellar protein FliL [Sulfidibacter corallicola]|uniref:Flagellar protein FliL n=1 Tax=Sulfidibacter corallicola TaxID=2818388 RepID=A0A8A4TTF4_SULCO|nr:flagellar basal body-associated FliL family protein [Sulfidibacter corallicola]QTD52434.1 flagellar basal body-associated FliL family protein [Sulfidibacter corallicola]
MAWEEESIDTGADFEEVGGKRNPLKLIIMAVAVLALAAGGFFAYKYFTKEKPATAEGEEGTGQEAEAPDVPVPATGQKVDLDKFTLNLADKGKPHYLVTTIALEVTTEELKTALDDATDPKLYRVKTRDTILRILRAKTFKEINDPATLKEVSKEIEFKLNRIYNQDGKVMNVYFTEFMVQ